MPETIFDLLDKIIAQGEAMAEAERKDKEYAEKLDKWWDKVDNRRTK